MKAYVKPTMNIVELRLEESIAGSGSTIYKGTNLTTYTGGAAVTVGTSSTMTGASDWVGFGNNS